MSYHSADTIAQANAIREGSKVADLLKFLDEEGVTCAEVIRSAIEGETNFVERIESLLVISTDVLGQIAAIDAWAEVLAARRRKMVGVVENLQAAVIEAMDRADQDRLATSLGTIVVKYEGADRVVEIEGAVDRVAVIDEAASPSQRIAALLREEGEIVVRIGGCTKVKALVEGQITTFKSVIETVREEITAIMTAANQTSVQTALGTVFFKTNNPEVTVVEEALIEEKFFDRKINKTALNKAVLDIEKRRRDVWAGFGDRVTDDEVMAEACILALWAFDDENPAFEGVSVGEQTKSLSIRKG